MFFSFLLSALAFISSFIPQPTFREGLLGQPKSLSPLSLGANQADKDISRFIFRSLLKYNEKGDIINDLAESYKISEDKKEYVFNLQKGVYWHDGKLFNADDILYTISQQRLETVEVDKLDDHTVKFRLIKDPYTPFLDLMTNFVLPSQSPKIVKNSLGVIGLGDFRIARIKKSNKVDSIILTSAWPWQRSKYKFSRIVFNFYEKEEDLLLAAKIGEIDAFALDRKVAQLNNFEQIKVPLASRHYALFFNLEKEKLKAKELRQFLEQITPREKVAEENFSGAAVASFGPLEYTMAQPLIEASVSQKALLKNLEEISLIITVAQPSLNQPEKERETHLKTAQIIKEAWQSSGIKVEFRLVPLEKIFDDVISRKDFEILLFGQEVGRDPDAYTLWHSTQKNLPGLNFGSFASVLADKALEEGRKEAKKEERIKHYQNFIKVFRDEVPAIFLYHPLFTYSFKKNIKGPDLTGLFQPQDRFINFSEWKRF